VAAAAAATARDRRKIYYCFFSLFIGKKHDLSKKKFSKFLV
jgi:hypothetical protein